LLEIGEEITPTGNGLGNAEAEEGEGHFGQYILRDEDCSLGEQDAGGFWKNVAAKEVDVGSPETSGGADEVAFFCAENDTADEPRGARPTNGPDDRDDKEEGLERIYRQREKGADGKKEVEPRQGKEEFGEAHQHIVLPAAKVASNGADAPTDEESEARAEQTGEERDLAAEEKPGELVTTEGVGAEQIDSLVAGAEKMDARGKKSQEAIGGTSDEEVERDLPRGVFDVLVECAGAQLERVDEGTKVEMIVSVHEMHPHRGQVRIFAVLLDRIVRGEKSGAEDDGVQDAEDQQPDGEFAAADHREALSVRIRGSSQ